MSRTLLLSVICFSRIAAVQAADLPDDKTLKPVRLITVPEYCEGVVFDKQGRGYTSHGKHVTRFTVDGKQEIWATTGAPNGHKILADGTHLICDASRHAVLHLTADGKLLPHASKACNGKALRGPNDLSLDTRHGGFYFTDPGGSGIDKLIGTVHYVDRAGKTHLIDSELAFPNGIILTPDGKKLYVGESQKNRILVYEVSGPGKVGKRQVLTELPKKNADEGQIDNQPDGMCLDGGGNIYVAHYGMRQVQVLNPQGKIIRRFAGGNLRTSNVAFGGKDHDQLFVTGSIKNGKGCVFRLDLKVRGRVVLPSSK